MFHNVQVPVITDKLSFKKRQQLEWLTGRDITVIKRYLNIIAEEEDIIKRLAEPDTIHLCSGLFS